MTDPAPASDRSVRLHAAVAEFLVAEEAGRPLDPAAWAAAHPDLRTELHHFLANRQLVQQAAAAAGHPPGPCFAPGDTFDGLRVVAPIRAGGMGQVYRAVQVELDREVAVKAVPLAAAHPASRHLFADEARALARLRHDHIVPVYGCGERGGVPYLVMELMAGTLRDRLAGGVLPGREAAAVLRTVAGAVQHAHDLGFLHRDIKPSNVLLDDRGVPHLGDFGVVARIAALGTAGTARAGTTAYMAPCQIEDRPAAVSALTDVYGLGAVLYECLTGRPPLDPAATAWAAPPPPSALNPRVDRRLEAVCLRCLARAPADRYPSAAAVAAALDRYLRPAGRWWAVAAVGVAAVAAFVWSRPPPPDATATDRERAERAGEYARLLGGVGDRAETRPPGWTWANRTAATAAAALDVPQRDPVRLRSELARTFAHPDLRPAGTFAAGPRYQAAAFRPGTRGGQVALGPLWRDKPARAEVRLYDPAADRLLAAWPLPYRTGWEDRQRKTDGVSAVAFTPDGRWLVVGSRSGGVFVIDPDRPDLPPQLLQLERETVRDLFPSADGLITVSLDGVARSWSVGDWRQRGTRSFLTDMLGDFSPRGAYLPATRDYLFLAHLDSKDPYRVGGVRFTGDLEEPTPRLTLDGVFLAPAAHPTAPVWVVAAHDTPQLVAADDLAAGRVPAVAPAFAAELGRYPERTGFAPDGSLVFAGLDGDRARVQFLDPTALSP